MWVSFILFKIRVNQNLLIVNLSAQRYSAFENDMNIVSI